MLYFKKAVKDIEEKSSNGIDGETQQTRSLQLGKKMRCEKVKNMKPCHWEW